jgi:uncharacterized coiled-coil DUF342 family protein
MTTAPTPLPVRRPHPDDVERVLDRVHQPVPNTLEDLGRMAGEAVLTQFDAVAKATEEMGRDVRQRIASLEAALVEADRDLKMIEEAAHVVRDKGKMVQAQVEQSAALSRELRETLAKVTKRLA